MMRSLVPALDRDRRRGRRVLAVRVLFIVGLVSWTSLAAWWATYLYRTNQQVRAGLLQTYAARQELVAMDMERRGLGPEGALALLETYPLPFAISPEIPEGDAREYPWVRLAGALEGWVVIVAPDEIQRLERESRRKIVMLAGEGALLVSLLFICLVALYRVTLSEWRLNQQIESFVHSITHELKSPIAGLKALLQTFAALEMKPEDRKTTVEIGLGELARLETLVGNVLLSAKLEADAFKPTIEPMDLGAMLASIERRKTPRAAAAKGRVSVSVGEGAGVVQADPFAIGIVVENLVENAITYTEGPPQVRLEAERAGELVALKVSDSGIGLEAEEAARVFEKFYRAPSGTRRHAKGTGLGLFLARQLARSCGGDLTVASEGRGKGCTFTLTMRGG